jgi:Bcr/CflA subfamily drug resistance transporter
MHWSKGSGASSTTVGVKRGTTDAVAGVAGRWTQAILLTGEVSVTVAVMPEIERRAQAAPLVLILGGLSATAPLGIDMYVAALPGIARELDASVSVAQWSVTAFLLGIVAGQLLFGPLSDRFGRRRLLLGGMAGSAVCSLACAVAPSIEVFIAARLLAGFFGAAGIVLARAVVTDLFEGPRRARYFSMTAIIMGVAPVLAPALGGLILRWGSWRIVFVVLAAISALLLVGVLRWVPESLPAERRSSGGSARSLRVFLRRWEFLAQVLVLSLAAIALFTYVSDSSFVFELYYGLSPTGYSLVFASNALAMLIASSVFGALAARVRPVRMLAIGLSLAVVTSTAHLVIVALAGGVFVATWLCLMGTLAGLGLVFPAVTTTAQSLGSDSPGAASALVGAGQFTLGAVLSPLSGLFSSGSPVPLAGVMTAGLVAAGVCLVFSRRTAQASRDIVAGS